MKIFNELKDDVEQEGGCHEDLKSSARLNAIRLPFTQMRDR